MTALTRAQRRDLAARLKAETRATCRALLEEPPAPLPPVDLTLWWLSQGGGLLGPEEGAAGHGGYAPRWLLAGLDRLWFWVWWYGGEGLAVAVLLLLGAVAAAVALTPLLYVLWRWHP